MEYNPDNWVDIPPGPFVYGADDDTPDAHPKQVLTIEQPYRIGRYPVTVAEYARFLAATGHREPAGFGVGPWPTQLRRPNHPVVGVSWEDAVAYCEWYTAAVLAQYAPGWVMGLPTEAQFERAARGPFDERFPNGRRFPWGDDEPTADHCNFDRNVGSTSPVGASPLGVSPDGCSDISGNVLEWSVAAFTDNSGKTTGERVVRGGSWSLGARSVRAADRGALDPGIRSYNLGFRGVQFGKS